MWGLTSLRLSLRYKYEYDLILKPDINTSGHTQWFYFCVQNTRRGQKYKFNIINLLKSDSLYNQGMQPVVYSKRGQVRGVVARHALRCH